MGILDAFKKKPVEENQAEESDSEAQGKYSDNCALCGKGNTEKKWMGQYWHKKCVRSAKKASKKMI